MSISTYIKMKACNQCHIKKSEVEFTKGKAVCKSCRAAIIKAGRTQVKFAENEEQRAEFSEMQRRMATAA